MKELSLPQLLTLNTAKKLKGLAINWSLVDDQSEIISENNDHKALSIIKAIDETSEFPLRTENHFFGGDPVHNKGENTNKFHLNKVFKELDTGRDVPLEFKLGDKVYYILVHDIHPMIVNQIIH